MPIWNIHFFSTELISFREQRFWSPVGHAAYISRSCWYHRVLQWFRARLDSVKSGFVRFPLNAASTVFTLLVTPFPLASLRGSTLHHPSMFEGTHNHRIPLFFALIYISICVSIEWFIWHHYLSDSVQIRIKYHYDLGILSLVLL